MFVQEHLKRYVGYQRKTPRDPGRRARTYLTVAPCS
jgi:hypothetical protein